MDKKKEALLKELIAIEKREAVSNSKKTNVKRKEEILETIIKRTG